jgi:5-methylcytosine-specific restriction endonuclease McrA
MKLKADPVCEAEGCGEQALTVHHVKPQSTHPLLRHAMANLQSLCHRHALAAHGKRPRPVVDMATGWAE